MAMAVEDVATTSHEQTNNDAGISSAREMGLMLDMPNSTVRKIQRNILQEYLCAGVANMENFVV